MQEEIRTPTHIWLDAKIRELSAQGQGIYVTHKGEKMSGLVMVKMSDCQGKCRLQSQQRNFETNVLDWVNVFDEEVVAEDRADKYITRATLRDPDQWVVEIENPEMKNPFNGF